MEHNIRVYQLRCTRGQHVQTFVKICPFLAKRWLIAKPQDYTYANPQEHAIPVPLTQTFLVLERGWRIG